MQKSEFVGFPSGATLYSHHPHKNFKELRYKIDKNI
jgi:hypothetical protein